MADDAEIQEQYRALMNKIAATLDKAFNGEATGTDRQTGFVLLVFPFGEGGYRANYISNGASRQDIASLFREMAARFEGQPEPPEGHA